MPLKFRLRGLAETFIDNIACPCCGHDGGDAGDEGFRSDLSRVTFDGIVVVIQCNHCAYVFVPDGQRLGVINSSKLREAVTRDSENTGQPACSGLKEVRLDVERRNTVKDDAFH